MKKNTTIALFYTGVAVLCIGIVSTAMWLAKGLNHPQQMPLAVNTGKDIAPQWFPIEKDLSAVNQDNQQIKLSDLRGKVWLVAEFFAVCPNCAVRNGTELRKIYDEFKSNPDFHITCISIDPESDNVERLGDYAKALGADSKNWWFVNAGDAAASHDYLEHTLKFMKIQNRIDPLDIETNGKYIHDMAFTLVDRDFNVIGKWDLVGLKSENGTKVAPGIYDKSKEELFARIRQELGKTNAGL
jgi:protein SCO1/2